MKKIIISWTSKTFEQIEIKKDKIGEKGKLLTENLNVSVSFYNDDPIAVELPNQINCKVETTDAALKGSDSFVLI